MKKKLLAMLLVICMALTLMPVGALAGEPEGGTIDPVLYTPGVANMVDHRTAPNKITQLCDSGTYKIIDGDFSDDSTGTTTNRNYTLVLGADNIRQHHNSEGSMGYWVGVAIPKVWFNLHFDTSGDTTTTVAVGRMDSGADIPTLDDSAYGDVEDKKDNEQQLVYDDHDPVDCYTFYFNAGTVGTGGKTKDGYIVVKYVRNDTTQTGEINTVYHKVKIDLSNVTLAKPSIFKAGFSQDGAEANTNITAALKAAKENQENSNVITDSASQTMWVVLTDIPYVDETTKDYRLEVTVPKADGNGGFDEVELSNGSKTENKIGPLVAFNTDTGRKAIYWTFDQDMNASDGTVTKDALRAGEYTIKLQKSTGDSLWSDIEGTDKASATLKIAEVKYTGVKAGATAPDDIFVDITENGEVTLETPTGNVEGFTFTGWECDGVTVTEDNKVTLTEAKEYTFTAGWESDSIASAELTVKGNDETYSPVASVTAKIGTPDNNEVVIKLTGAIPALDGDYKLSYTLESKKDADPADPLEVTITFTEGTDGKPEAAATIPQVGDYTYTVDASELKLATVKETAPTVSVPDEPDVSEGDEDAFNAVYGSDAVEAQSPVTTEIDALLAVAGENVTEILAKGEDGKTYTVEVSLKVEPTAYSSTDTTLELEITPVVTLTSEDADVVDVPVTDPAIINKFKNVPEPVTITVTAPAGFVTDANKNNIYVDHNGDYISTTANDTTQKITFETTSFSPFKVFVDDTSVTVTFNDAAGTAVTNFSSITWNLSNIGAALPANPTQANKVFDGWAKDGDTANTIVISKNATTLTKELLTALSNSATGGSITLIPVFSDAPAPPAPPPYIVGSVTPGNAVTAPTAANGKVSVSSATAKQGDTVTVTVTPDKGYELDALTVTDAAGKAVTVTKTADGKYTFTMPATAVKVNATFKKVSAMPFTDVASGAWYYDAVSYVYENGLMNGTADTLFSPDMTTTRGMVVTLLYRLEGQPTAPAPGFIDVPDGLYYSRAVAWATVNKIVNGYGDGTFKPEDTITREQLATMLYRYADYKGYDVSAKAGLAEFTDAGNVSAYAKDALGWAVAKSLVNGVGSSTIAPQGDANRAQLATILMRFCENIAK